MNVDIVELTEEDPQYACCFCTKSTVNSVEWGPLYKLDDLVLHYFCMLFSSGLVQEGNDNEGILGFLPKDVFKEVSRGRKLKCRFCRKSTATVGCVVTKCKTSFHYPCGLENGALFQFQGHFASYCKVHKPKQHIPSHAEWICPICIMEVESEIEAVWPPCCGKSVFHRSCIMHAAKEAGYFFKCPLCNCTDEFLDAMKANGVYVPEQDAAWETVPGAYAELTEHYTNCDAEACLCPEGRNYESKDDRNWKIIRCSGCGASAVHMCCGGLSTYSWKCSTCENVLKNMVSERGSVSSEEIPHAASSRVERISDNEESSSSSSPSESESEDESSEDSSESTSESSESEAEQQISQTVTTASSLIDRRRQFREHVQQGSSSEFDSVDDKGVQKPRRHSKPFEFNLNYGKHSNIKGVGTAAAGGNADATCETLPPESRSARHDLRSYESESPNKIRLSPNKVKLSNLPNRIRNPHLHNSPTFGKRLQELRNSQPYVEEKEISSSASPSEGEDGIAAIVKRRTRMNTNLSAEQLAAKKAKNSEESVRNVLQRFQRSAVDVTALPRIPKVTSTEVSITRVRVSVLEQNEPPPSSISSSSTPNKFRLMRKPLSQTKLDKWLSTHKHKQNDCRKNLHIEDLQVDPDNQNRSAYQDIESPSKRRDRDTNIVSEIRSFDDDVLEPWVCDEVPTPAPSTSSSETSRAQIIEQLKAKVPQSPPDKFKRPNKSRHQGQTMDSVLSTPSKSVASFSPTTSNPLQPQPEPIEIDADEDDLKIIEEKLIEAYPSKTYDDIPKSSAFLAMVGGHLNKLLVGNLKAEIVSPAKSNAPKEIMVVDLDDSEDDDDDNAVSSATTGTTIKTLLRNPAFVGSKSDQSTERTGLGLTTTISDSDNVQADAIRKTFSPSPSPSRTSPRLGAQVLRNKNGPAADQSGSSGSGSGSDVKLGKRKR